MYRRGIIVRLYVGRARAGAAGARGMRQRHPHCLPANLLRKPAPPHIPRTCQPTAPPPELPPCCSCGPTPACPCPCPDPCFDLCGEKAGGGEKAGSGEGAGGGSSARGSDRRRALSMSNINPNVVKLEYAVRGPIVDRAFTIMREIKEGTLKKPYKKVIEASVGDAHAMGQAPITFLRQVLSAMTYPELMKTYKYPEDVTKRAKELLAHLGGGSVGAYTASMGIEVVRHDVADYIARRDGYPALWEDVAISNGASASIKIVLQLFSNNPNGKKTGVMVPIPQYPLYSATIAEYGLEMAPYYLDEEHNWGLKADEMQRSIKEARDKGLDVRAIVIINPGNPTGQVLSHKNIEEVIKFAHEHSLFIFADEVYQDNVYVDKFYSFKKVLREMGSPYSESVELGSYMSISKGYAGECGLRGGWMELVNMDPQVQAHLYKSISALLSPSVIGQACTDLVAKPPQPGEPSYELWRRETDAVLGSLRERAVMVADAFNQMEGFKCNTVQGAMYAFPSFVLPEKAIQAAKNANLDPDLFYAFELLEETGICVVPGSGFGQAPGTHHFRTTILPSADVTRHMLQLFKSFHQNFTKKYS